MRGIPAYLRLRVIDRIAGTEVTNDLPHLHRSSWHIVAMQPGNPSSSAVGTFNIPLFPPGSSNYKLAKPTYDKLKKYQRVEAYISHNGASLGKLYAAGVITGRKSSWSGGLQLDGMTDLALANYSRPFPGELLPNDLTSKVIQSYMGTNELGWSDAFAPFVTGNYVSTNLPGGTAGTWTSTTDDGFPVVSCTTGTNAVLISQAGAIANDRWHSQFVEVSGRLTPSTSTTDAGVIGVGISSSPANANTCVVGYVEAIAVGSRYNLTIGIASYSAGVMTHNNKVLNALTNVDDPQGQIPFTVGLYLETSGTSTGEAILTVNGNPIIRLATGYSPGVATNYPFLHFETPTSGTAVSYFTNFNQQTRFTPDGASTASVFAPGSITTATNSLGPGTNPGGSFLDVWSACATREGWYWRYTPQPYVIGTRTFGKVDFGPDPGTDYGTSKKIVFSKLDGSLVDLELDENADPFMTGTAAISTSTPDGGGVGYFRDIASMAAYGIVEDVSIVAANDFNNLRRGAFQVVANKIATDSNAGAKVATILRTPETSDVARELDKIMVHDPEQNVNYQVSRILAYTFDEGVTIQQLALDQFSRGFTGQPNKASLKGRNRSRTTGGSAARARVKRKR